MILQKNKPFLFLVINFSLIILMTIVLFLLNFRFTNSRSFLMMNCYSIIPFLSVWLVKKVIYRENFFEKHYWNFQIDASFLWIVYFLFGLQILVVLFNMLLPGISFTLDQDPLFAKYYEIFTKQQMEVFLQFSSDFSIIYFWMFSLFMGMLFGMTIGAFFTYFSELAWRGFLLDEYELMGFWKSSLYVGFWCGLFQVPLAFLGLHFTENMYWTIFLLIAWNILVSPILVLLRNFAESVVYPAIFMAVANSTSFLATFFIVGEKNVIIGFKGLVGIIVLLIVDILIYFYMKNRAKFNKGE